MTSSSGTSFSGPIMAGLIACLNGSIELAVKSSNYNINSDRIFLLKESIFQSADKYQNPLDQYGYGIPNFEQAYRNSRTGSVKVESTLTLNVYPNPVKDSFILKDLEGGFEELNYKIFNIIGKKVLEKSKLTSNIVDVSKLKKGVYLLKIQKGNQQKILKLIKQ